jgi:hypothetical protein
LISSNRGIDCILLLRPESLSLLPALFEGSTFFRHRLIVFLAFLGDNV